MRQLIVAGAGRAVPTLQGMARNLPTRSVDPNDTVLVRTGEYGYGSARVDGSRYLVTFGIYPCVALMTRNPNSGVTFLAHLGSGVSVLDAFSKGVSRIGGTDAYLFGGQVRWSDGIVAAVEGMLAESPLAEMVTVLGRDLLRDPRDRGTSIGIDSLTGQLFVPQPETGFKRDPNQTSQEGRPSLDGQSLAYAEDRRHPPEDFIVLVR